jgi:hypothetical protein
MASEAQSLIDATRVMKFLGSSTTFSPSIFTGPEPPQGR